MHQLALAMVQGVLTGEASCYEQTNDSSRHVSEIFMKVLEIPRAMFDLTVPGLQNYVYHLFRLQNVEVRILYLQT